MKSAKAAAMSANFGLAPRRGVSLGTSRHETASFALIASPEKRGGITWRIGENHIHQRLNSIPSQAG